MRPPSGVSAPAPAWPCSADAFQDDQAKQQGAIRQEQKLSRRFVARATFVLAKVAKTAGA